MGVSWLITVGVDVRHRRYIPKALMCACAPKYRVQDDSVVQPGEPGYRIARRSAAEDALTIGEVEQPQQSTLSQACTLLIGGLPSECGVRVWEPVLCALPIGSFRRHRVDGY
jgi:hypothetical protein